MHIFPTPTPQENTLTRKHTQQAQRRTLKIFFKKENKKEEKAKYQSSKQNQTNQPIHPQNLFLNASLHVHVLLTKMKRTERERETERERQRERQRERGTVVKL